MQSIQTDSDVRPTSTSSWKTYDFQAQIDCYPDSRYEGDTNLRVSEMVRSGWVKRRLQFYYKYFYIFL
jgi:hypothetical protein